MSTEKSGNKRKSVAIFKSLYEKIQGSNVDRTSQVFRQFDKENTGYINYYELKPALELLGVSFYYSQCYHKMISELKDQSGKISFFDFTKIVIEKNKEDADDSSDILDAFVAMGGDDNGDGSVDADQLVKIIKSDFGLTIDIEALIKEIDSDGSGQIELDEFNQLLESEGENPEIGQFKEWFTF